MPATSDGWDEVYAFYAYGGARPAPLVPILIGNDPEDRTRILPGLVDSGADCSTFPAELAGDFGLNLDDLHEGRTSTASGDGSHYIGTDPLQVSLGSAEAERWKPLDLSACFAPGCPIILLGRIDFFAYFDTVAFDVRRGLFRIVESDLGGHLP